MLLVLSFHCFASLGAALRSSSAPCSCQLSSFRAQRAIEAFEPALYGLLISLQAPARLKTRYIDFMQAVEALLTFSVA